MGLKDFFKNLAGTPALLPHLISIPNQNTDNAASLEGLFEPNQHYFTVRVNEMFLSDQRKWFREIEPAVICVTSYQYGGQTIDNPFVVDRSLIESKKELIPQGMLFYDTRIAGIHPFAGSRLTIGLILCQSQTRDYLADSLEFIQKVTGVVNKNIGVLVGSYVEIAKVVIGAIDKLFDSGAVQPLFGFRKEFDQDANDRFAPGYFVMLDKSENKWEAEQFFVKDNRLYYGEDKQSAKEFRGDEYVLFSITKSDDRGDFKSLPFYKTYNNILEEMKEAEISADRKQKIKEMLRVLNIEMKQSPDLTEPHAQELIDKFINDVGKMIQPKYNWSAAKAVKQDDFWSRMDAKIAAM